MKPADKAAETKKSPFRILSLGIFLLLALCACHKPESEKSDAVIPQKLVIPEHGAYTGAFIEFGDTEDDVTLEGIEGFEDLVGKHQAIIASSSYWGEQSFPTDNINLIWRHGSIPLLFWSPWAPPYEEDRGIDRYNLTGIIEGKWDDYIDSWGDSIKKFGHPIFVSFANEMNGTWFPWSGFYYGAEKPVPNTHPQQYEGPETYKKAFRHVVDRVRARGARNVLWVFHLNNYPIPYDTWNQMASYYPGPDYVDWLGLSVYGKQYSDERWPDFLWLIDDPYKEICALDPHKPVMITEWSVGEYPQSGNKGQWIHDGFDEMKNQFPRIKAEIFWHERWQNEDDSYSNLRVNSSPESLEAYRKGVADPYWLGTPILSPAKK